MRSLIQLLAASLAVAGALDAQPGPRKTTAEVFRRGGMDAPAPYDFPRAPELVVSESGFILARVARDAVVLVFDANGDFVRRIGRRGRGPGEFTSASAHGVIGDTLWVVDWPTPRMATFTTSGAQIATANVPFDFGYSFGAPTGISGLLRGGRAFAMPPYPVRGVDGRMTLPLLVGDAQMRDADTAALLPNPKGLFVDGIGTWAFEPIPVGPLVGIDPRGTGIAVVSWDVAAPNELVVRLVAPSGDTRWERRFPAGGAEIPARVRDSILNEAIAKARPQYDAARRRGAPVVGSVRDAVTRGLFLPRHFSPARRVLIGVDRTIWIERMNGLAAGSWLVLTADGTALFSVDVPRGFHVDDASAQAIWGTLTDELGVAYMMKLRIIDR